MLKTVRLGFLGCGNIGGGVWHLLNEMHDQILERDQLDIRVVRALVKSIPEARTDVPSEILTENAEDVLSNPEVDIVCEFMGGEQPAARFMEAALEHQKTVVTANKMALALNWHKLDAAARRNHVGLYYEASVGGVIPIIRSLTQSLEADRIDQIMGIVNGTTNYILTRMSKEGSDYAAVLAEAQRLGLAEPNPSADVEGYDAAYKLSILSSIAFHTHVTYDKIYREGITHITAADIAYGKEMGYTLKLLAIGKRNGQSVEVRVHPTFLPADHPLSKVDGSLNAIYLNGAYCRDMMLQGRGAGDMPTASAICGDIIFAAQHQEPTFPSFKNTPETEPAISYSDDWVSRYFIRINAQDEPGVLAAILRAFADQQISVASMLQKPSHDGKAQVILITHEANERAMQRTLTAIHSQSAQVESFIRVES